MWKRPNVLIGVSGNGRYLTTIINQSGVKRLEARNMGETTEAVEMETQLPCPSVLHQSRTHTDTLAAVFVTLNTECRKRMQP